jgi:Flp pilus assembly protein TadG
VKRIDLQHVLLAQRRQHGQSIVEMALVLPFLVLILLGTIEFGYYIYTYSEIEYATRRASERAAKTPPIDVTDPNDRCTALIKADALQGSVVSQLRASDIQVSFPPNNQREIGDQVRVDVSYDGAFLTPVGEQMLGNVMRFRFTSQRTIVSFSPPNGYTNDCEPQ